MKDTYGACVLVSAPGMHETATRVLDLLTKRDAEIPFSHMEMQCTQFANGELKPYLPETVRGEHVFFLTGMQHPDPNTALVQMLLANDAIARASASGITLVAPYLSYLRQDRKDKPRVPISARVVADLIESNKKVERLITLDMHADQIQGFFSIPVDNMNGMVVHADYFRKRFDNDFADVVVVAPDFGSAVRSRRFAQKLGADVPVSIIDKRRPAPNVSEVINFVGQHVAKKTVIIYDDLIDTGGTIRHAVAEIMQQDAHAVYICATHGLFTNNSEQEFSKAGYPVIVTPSIPRPDDYWATHARWLTKVSIDELLANAIFEASHVGGSISKLSQ